MFFRQDPYALTVVTEAASDDLQQYLAGVRHQQNTPVVAALCPIPFLWSTLMMYMERSIVLIPQAELSKLV